MLGIFSALLGAFGFGTANIVIKKSLGNLTAPQILMMSTLSGIGWLLLLMLASRAELSFSGRDVGLALGLAVMEVGLYLLLYKTFEVSNVTIATSLISAYPILATLVAAGVFQEVINGSQWAAIGLLVLGAVGVSLDWSALTKTGWKIRVLVKGWPWILVSLLIHAAYFPLLGQFTTTGSWESKLLLIKLLSALLLVGFFGLRRKSRLLPPQNRVAFLSLLGLLEMMGWAGFSWAANSTLGQTAVLIAILNSAPLITIIWAYFILREKLSKFQYLSMGLIVAGLTWLGLK